MTKMFSCVTGTWNALGGRCPHDCVYCWSMGEKGLVERFNMKKYRGEIRLFEREFKRKFKDGEFIFVQDMSDLFADEVPAEYIIRVLRHIEKFPKATFLLLTKNPKRYYTLDIPKNCICGATIESDIDHKVSNVMSPVERGFGLWVKQHPRKMISIEPIMEFNFNRFVALIKTVSPEFVYVGFDNYDNNLPEPSIEKVDILVRRLSKFTEVREKPSVEKRRRK